VLFGIKHHKDSNLLIVSSRPTGSDLWNTNATTEDFDYISDSVPFNLLRSWDLPPYYSLMKGAIERTVFDECM